MRYAAMIAGVMAALGAAPDLNAPLDTRPTLASEMRRGWSAEAECYDVRSSPLEYGLCVSRLGDRESARIGDPTPYKLGLYLRAWASMDLRFRSDGELAASNAFAAADLPGARRECASDALVARGLQKRLGLTDAQLMSATGYKSVEDIAARWAYWTSLPLAEIAYPR
jgi:hypothetical protein